MDGFAGYLFACTAAKVGPRHFLIDRGCMLGQRAPSFVPGAQLHLTARNIETGGPTHHLTIQQVNLHPRYATCTPSCGGCNCDTHLDAPSIAVIVVATDTPDIPQASVDVSPVQYGTSLVKLGFSNIADCNLSKGDMQLAFGPSQSGVSDGPAPMALSIMAAGNSRDPAFASLACGNDGPLYLGGAKQGSVVGLNSGFSLGDGSGSLSSWDYFNRVDTSARFPVASWLASLGVNVIRSVPSPSPFSGTPAAIPGTIQAEDFDLGEPEVAYHDTSPENFPSAAYRVEGVDIDSTADVDGGYNIGARPPANG